jgi:hypothetical protein
VSITGAIDFHEPPPATGGPSCHPLTSFHWFPPEGDECQQGFQILKTAYNTTILSTYKFHWKAPVDYSIIVTLVQVLN